MLLCSAATAHQQRLTLYHYAPGLSSLFGNLIFLVELDTIFMYGMFYNVKQRIMEMRLKQEKYDRQLTDCYTLRRNRFVLNGCMYV